jgi:hypothetical protein
MSIVDIAEITEVGAPRCLFHFRDTLSYGEVRKAFVRAEGRATSLLLWLGGSAAKPNLFRGGITLSPVAKGGGHLIDFGL